MHQFGHWKLFSYAKFHNLHLVFAGLAGREEGCVGDNDVFQACRNGHDSDLLRQAGRHVAP